MLPTRLPPSLSSFVGHEDDLAELARLLAPSSLAAAAPDEARPAVRLLTLTGPGGIGKSRLAIEVAARLAAHYRDGAHAVPLAAIDDSELTAAAVAQAAGINLSPGRRAGDELCAALQDKHMLLLLDNLDQVTSAAPLLADLLAAAPHLTFLVTSREPLHIPGEQEFPVPPLVLPDPRNLPPVERLLDFSAIALFVQRARAVRPDFSLTNDSAPAAIRVCRGLDGLPLAIELAAARVKTLSVEQIAARLADCLDLLTQGDRTALPRHRTLRAAIDWSYDLLAETERDLFRRLAIFPGSFTLAAAVAVGAVNGESSSALLDRLAVLVDKSLVMAIPAHAEVRYRILETIRRYALDKLAETGEMPAVQRRNLGYLLSGAEEAHQALAAANREAGLAWFDTEHANLRGALAWCRENSETDVALRLTAALEPFWHLNGEVREGRAWLGRLFSIGRDPASNDGKAPQDLIPDNTLPARNDRSDDMVSEPPLAIFTLGPERVCLGSRVLTTADLTYAKAREMLLYLMCNSPRSKEQIGLALWPDASDNQLHNNFRVTLHHLRRALGRSEWIIFEDGVYRFNRSLPHWIDFEVFESHVIAARKSLDADQAIAHLQTAISIYAGDFLEALSSDWPMFHREELRRLYQSALLLLGRLLFAAARYAEALEIYHRALAQDSYLETAHRGVMRCLIRLGERVQALRHYDALVALFEEEMGSPPAQRTVSLAEHLRQGHEV